MRISSGVRADVNVGVAYKRGLSVGNRTARALFVLVFRRGEGGA